MTDLQTDRSTTWRWSVCGLLLLATMLNYMDRQTLSLTKTDIEKELHTTNENYGSLEAGFGLAFAVGGILTGFLVDRISVFWMYPIVLIGWSLAGIATAYATRIGDFLVSCGIASAEHSAFTGMMVCRVILGLFEAGQWPCALVISQRILSRQDRTLGNSLLQSGAAMGAIVTPIIVQMMVTNETGTWRGPFQVIGFLGIIWIIPWFAMMRRDDLNRTEKLVEPVETPSDKQVAAGLPTDSPTNSKWLFAKRYLALAITVISINLCWHFFRAWLPTFLREFHEYTRKEVNFFTSAYFIATDVGCITVGLSVKWLTTRGWKVHSARMTTFFLCSLLTALSTVASQLPKGPALLGILLVIGFGALGLFPNYYSFSQELTTRHQGKLTGTLSCITWTFTAIMQKYAGREIDASHSYATGIFLVGLAPLVACVALWLLWDDRKQKT